MTRFAICILIIRMEEFKSRFSIWMSIWKIYAYTRTNYELLKHALHVIWAHTFFPYEREEWEEEEHNI